MTNKQTIIRDLRALIPARALTLSEAFKLAEKQAAKALTLLGIIEVPVDVARIAELPKITVQVQPRHRMTNLSGFSQWANGRWLIVINKNSVEGRRRFTLAHEFKHVLDHTIADVAYAKFGHGDAEKRSRQIEQICDYFAACLLMPAPVLKKMWYSGIQDIEQLAQLFRVSGAAMEVRLNYFGFLEDDRDARSYFRSDTPFMPPSLDNYGLAA